MTDDHKHLKRKDPTAEDEHQVHVEILQALALVAATFHLPDQLQQLAKQAILHLHLYRCTLVRLVKQSRWKPFKLEAIRNMQGQWLTPRL